MKKNLLLFIMVLLVASIKAQTFTVGGINYTVTVPGEVQVAPSQCYVGDLVLPSTVTNMSVTYAVTSLSDYSFYACAGLTSVTIPNSVTNLGTGSFRECTSLASVIISNSVTSIGEQTFLYCSSLTSVIIPNSVTNLKIYAFYGCTNLTSVTIPNSVITIGDYAFYQCTNLPSITIPNSVTSLGYSSFASCPILSSITIPSSVTSIGNYAFYGCTGLTSVTSLTTTPVAINGTVFELVNVNAIPLYVPSASIAAYEAHLVWTNFNPILPSAVAVSFLNYTNCGGTSDTVNPTFYCTTPNVGSSTLAYRFVFKNMITLAEVTVDRAVPNAHLLLTNLAAYNTTYSVKVAAVVDGIEQPYSADCTITTPVLPTNKVVEAQCGTTLAALNSTINVPAVIGAQNYRFRVAESTAPGTTEVITSPYPSFRLSSLTTLSLDYGKMYLVEVQSDIINNGVPETSAYGQICTISTPSVVSISTSTNNCGGSLAAINSKIYVNSVLGANQYTYRVALASNPGVYNDIVTPFTNFRLTSLTTVPLLYNEVYNVQVAVRVTIGGIDFESGFGSVCTYTTPMSPTSKVQVSQCGDEFAAYQVPSNTTSIVATFVSGASYRFKLEQGAFSQTISRPVNNFTLSMFTGLMADTEYSVSVALDYYGAGEFGNHCTIKTPTTVIARTMSTPFSVVGYPNPFADNFKLEVKSNSASIVNIKVYDILGRLVEDRSSKMTELVSATIGDRYPSGVYNVIVTQDEDVSSSRMIKR